MPQRRSEVGRSSGSFAFICSSTSRSRMKGTTGWSLGMAGLGDNNKTTRSAGLFVWRFCSRDKHGLAHGHVDEGNSQGSRKRVHVFSSVLNAPSVRTRSSGS